MQLHSCRRADRQAAASANAAVRIVSGFDRGIIFTLSYIGFGSAYHYVSHVVTYTGFFIMMYACLPGQAPRYLINYCSPVSDIQMTASSLRQSPSSCHTALSTQYLCRRVFSSWHDGLNQRCMIFHRFLDLQLSPLAYGLLLLMFKISK